MHPNAYLRALWQNVIREQVFVAMPFDDRFRKRFETILAPAIEAEPLAGRRLRAYRVDNSRSGDSILTDIVDNIAHSRLILADVSIIDEGHITEQPVRNGNVMYEVGVALACRQPSEVLLVRDDSKKLLFDTSSIPHLTVDFKSVEAAVSAVRVALEDRLTETDSLRDARVQIAAKTLTQDELRVLKHFADLKPNEASDIAQPRLGMLSAPDERGVAGLLRKGCIESFGINEAQGSVYYTTTPFGYVLAEAVRGLLQSIRPSTSSTDDAAPSVAP